MKQYDIAILGGGPGGYTAAIRASQLGMDVCLIEKDTLGGTCLNTGCIPTKALYHSAEVFNTVKNSKKYGIESSSPILNMDTVIERKNEIVSYLVGGVKALLESNKIDVINGSAEIKSPYTVIVKNPDNSQQLIHTRNVIVATGARASELPVPGSSLPGVNSSDDILSAKKLPEQLVVIGGGIVGVELANVFSAFGSDVMILEFLPHILPTVDNEIRNRLIPIMKKNNIKVHTSTKVKEFIKDGPDVAVKAVTRKGEIQIPADRVLIATGRKPNVDGLGLGEIGVEYTENGIAVDDSSQTTIKGIYAIGDVTGGVMLAHKAAAEGVSAVEHIAELPKEIAPLGKINKVIPGCIFSFPEIAYVGMTEDEAKEHNIDYGVGKFMFGANGKSLALGEDRGLVKVISDETHKIIGVHILGPHASDLIHEGVLAINMKLNEEDIENTIHAHPTLAEAFHEAVLDLNGISINKNKQNR